MELNPESEVEEIHKGGRLQTVKHDGLYVDIRDGRLQDPLATSATVPAKEIDALEKALIGLSQLVPLADLDDEGMDAIHRMGLWDRPRQHPSASH